MGWRDGQGVGQRIDARRLARMKASARARALRNAVQVCRLWGCRMPSAYVSQGQGDQESSDDEEVLAALEGKTFAPRDVTIAAYSAKDNVHGIGYIPLSAAVRCACMICA